MRRTSANRRGRDVMFTRNRKVMSRTYLLDGIVAAKALDSRR
jgi:hypothetical protein